MFTLNKLHRLQNLLFLLIVALLPFNARHVFNYQSIQQIESFREHLTYSLFAFDLPLLALVAIISVEAYQTFRHSMKMDSVTYEVREYSINFHHIRALSKNPFFYYFIAVFISALLSQNKTIAFYNAFRIIQSASFFLVAVYLFSYRKKVFYYTTLAVFAGGIFQSLLAIFQFMLQRSLGLDFLGESSLSRSTLGVAKFEFGGEKFIRAYGTFPHPNLLGFFLLFALACGLWLATQKFKKERDISGIALMLGNMIISSGILLSYSRSVISASAILLATLAVSHRKSVISFYSSCCKKLKIPNLAQGAIALIMFFTFLFLVYNLLAPRLCLSKCPGDYSFELRTLYNKCSNSLITSHPFFGVGPGNFVPHLKSNFSGLFKPWEFQPAHNLYFLISAEIGLIGLVTFLIVIAYIILRLKLTSKDFLKSPFAILFLLVLALGFVDHYEWALVQGQMLFWLALAFFASIKKKPLFGKFY